MKVWRGEVSPINMSGGVGLAKEIKYVIVGGGGRRKKFIRTPLRISNGIPLEGKNSIFVKRGVLNGKNADILSGKGKT